MDPLTGIATLILALATAADGYEQAPKESGLRQMLDFMASMAAMVRQIQKTSSDAYVNVPDYLLDRGKHYPVQTLTDEQLAYVKKVMDSSSFEYEIKQCFGNAQWALVYDHDKRLGYVEGYALGQAPIPVHHAWLTVDGAPVEPTWRLFDRQRDPFDPSVLPMIQPLPSFAYFGVEFDRKKLIKQMHEQGAMCSVLDDWKNNWPELRQPRIRPAPSG